MRSVTKRLKALSKFYRVSENHPAFRLTGEGLLVELIKFGGKDNLARLKAIGKA
ncbi:MAG: hypothetical protein LBQ18_03325 [Campylobacteraceae bacterium]|jgi:hypothetical protein|nr:hypothetical protein [Campylobacteraceae bacterium]